MRAPLPHSDLVPHGLMGVQMQRRPLLLQVIRRIEIMMFVMKFKYYEIKMNLYTLFWLKLISNNNHMHYTMYRCFFIK